MCSGMFKGNCPLTDSINYVPFLPVHAQLDTQIASSIAHTVQIIHQKRSASAEAEFKILINSQTASFCAC